MASYWLRDEQGRELGPVGLEVVADLLRAERISRRSLISGDDKATWRKLDEVPELSATATPSPEQRQAEQRAQAAKILARFQSLRGLRPHEMFQVPADAPVEKFREAYFRISKPFHPDKLPPDAVPELREACATAFRILSALMARAEASTPAPPLAGPKVVAPSAEPPRVAPRTAPVAARPPPPEPKPEPKPAPSYDLESFVGLNERAPGEYDAIVNVTSRSVRMFLDHPLVNLRQNGFFIPTSACPVHLGQSVLVELSFEGDARKVKSRGKVSLESASNNARPGYGITLSQFDKKDKEFIEQYIARVQEEQKKQNAAQAAAGK